MAQTKPGDPTGPERPTLVSLRGTGASLANRGHEARGRIVLVEDDCDIGEAVAYSLRRAGFSVLIAQTGEAGFDAVCRGADLVLLDLSLPDLDGLEVCRRLRRRKGSAKTPVLVVSARSEPQDREAAFQAGADDYLTKPFSMRDLVVRCRAVLRRPVGL